MARFERFCAHNEVGELGGRGATAGQLLQAEAGPQFMWRPSVAQVSRYSTDLRQQVSKIHLLAAVAAAAQKSHSAGRPFAIHSPAVSEPSKDVR